MTKWDALKTEMDKILVDMSDIGFAIEFSKLWNQIEEEGDRLDQIVEKTTVLANAWCSTKSGPYDDAFSDPSSHVSITRTHGRTLKAILSKELRRDEA